MWRQINSKLAKQSSVNINPLALSSYGNSKKYTFVPMCWARYLPKVLYTDYIAAKTRPFSIISEIIRQSSWTWQILLILNNKICHTSKWSLLFIIKARWKESVYDTLAHTEFDFTITIKIKLYLNIIHKDPSLNNMKQKMSLFKKYFSICYF